MTQMSLYNLTHPAFTNLCENGLTQSLVINGVVSKSNITFFTILDKNKDYFVDSAEFK